MDVPDRSNGRPSRAPSFRGEPLGLRLLCTLLGRLIQPIHNITPKRTFPSTPLLGVTRSTEPSALEVCANPGNLSRAYTRVSHPSISIRRGPYYRSERSDHSPRPHIYQSPCGFLHAFTFDSVLWHWSDIDTGLGNEVLEGATDGEHKPWPYGVLYVL